MVSAFFLPQFGFCRSRKDRFFSSSLGHTHHRSTPPITHTVDRWAHSIVPSFYGTPALLQANVNTRDVKTDKRQSLPKGTRPIT